MLDKDREHTVRYLIEIIPFNNSPIMFFLNILSVLFVLKALRLFFQEHSVQDSTPLGGNMVSRADRMTSPFCRTISQASVHYWFLCTGGVRKRGEDSSWPF